MNGKAISHSMRQPLPTKARTQIPSLFLKLVISALFIKMSTWGCHASTRNQHRNAESTPKVFGSKLEKIDEPLANATLLLATFRLPQPPSQDATVATCTAVAISSRTLLTAAHCVINAQSSRVFSAKPKTWRDVDKDQLARIVKIDYLDHLLQESTFNWSRSQGSDLAKLTLDRDLPSHITPVTLADPKDFIINTIMSNPDAPYMSLEYRLLGRGCHDGNKNQNGRIEGACMQLQISQYKQKMENPLLIMNHATNPGDSGAPLFTRNSRCQWVLLGILSGARDIESGNGAMTRVSVFVPIPVHWKFITESR